MNKTNENASLETLNGLLDPFLKCLAQLKKSELKERIISNIYHPLLENNKTVVEESSEDEEAMAKKEHLYRTVDGGKLPPKT